MDIICHVTGPEAVTCMNETFVWTKATDLNVLPSKSLILYILSVTFLVLLSAVLSGLSLGLLSLDKLSLEILRNSGDTKRRAQAERIMKLTQDQHRLLISLLLWDMTVDMTLAVFLDRLLSPILTIIFSVTLLLIFTEIVPQAVAKKYGLQIGSSSFYFVNFLLFTMYPIAYPLARLLDRTVGVEPLTTLQRKDLAAFLQIHSQTHDPVLFQTESDLMVHCLNSKMLLLKDFQLPLSQFIIVGSDSLVSADLRSALKFSAQDILILAEGKYNYKWYMRKSDVLAISKDDVCYILNVDHHPLPIIDENKTCHELAFYFHNNKELDAVLVQNHNGVAKGIITRMHLTKILSPFYLDPMELIDSSFKSLDTVLSKNKKL